MRVFHEHKTAALLLMAALVSTLAAPTLAQERGDDGDRPSKKWQGRGHHWWQQGHHHLWPTAGQGAQDLGADSSPTARSGAPAPTRQTRSPSRPDVKVEGTVVPKGTYSLFFLPQEGEWTVILNKTAKQWGAFGYKADDDQMRATVKPKAADNVEELTYEVTDDGIVLRWEKLAVPVGISG